MQRLLWLKTDAYLLNQHICYLTKWAIYNFTATIFIINADTERYQHFSIYSTTLNGDMSVVKSNKVMMLLLAVDNPLNGVELKNSVTLLLSYTSWNLWFMNKQNVKRGGNKNKNKNGKKIYLFFTNIVSFQVSQTIAHFIRRSRLHTCCVNNDPRIVKEGYPSIKFS